MIIELVGLPGSGKSTFARKIARKNKFTIVRLDQMGEILAYNFLFALRHPIRFFVLFLYVARNLSRGMRYEKFVNLFLVHNAKYMKARRYPYALIDQGYYQSVISLFERPLAQSALKRFTRWILQPDHLILFNIPKEERLGRIATRGHGVREHLSNEDRARWEEAAEKNFSSLAETPLALACCWSVRHDEDLFFLEKYFHSTHELFYILNARMPTEKAYGNQTAMMCKEFARHGAHVELLAPLETHNATDDVFRYYNIKPHFGMRYIRGGDIRFLHAISRPLWFYAKSIAYLVMLCGLSLPRGAIVYVRKPEIGWLMKRKGHTVVYECHDWFSGLIVAQLFLLRSVDIIVATNNFIRQKFLENGFSSERVVVLPNGVDATIFSIDIPQKAAREELRLGDIIADVERKKILLYTGSFKTMSVDKGISDILKALRLLKDTNIVFCAVGGNASDIAYYTQEAKDIGVSEQTYFFERQSKERLALFQRAADILLMPFPRKAHYEYFMSPLKTFEYMASGRPTIASDLPSIREILGNDTAFFCKPDDPESLAECIKSVLKDKDLAERLASRARECVKQYTWKERAKRVFEIAKNLNDHNMPITSKQKVQ